MTPIALAVLKAIRDYWESEGMPPSMRDIRDLAGVRSTNTAWHNTHWLHTAGYVEFRPAVSRSARLTDAGRAFLEEQENG